MTSADFLNYASGSSAVITALGTFAMSWLTLRKSTRIEKHTNGMVEVLTKQSATAARREERADNVARGGTTGEGPRTQP